MNISATLSLEQKATYLLTLPAIRERCGLVYEQAKLGKLDYFDYHPEKEADVVAACSKIMEVSGVTTAL